MVQGVRAFRVAAVLAGLTASTVSFAGAAAHVQHSGSSSSGVSGDKTNTMVKKTSEAKYDEVALADVILVNNNSYTCAVSAAFGLMPKSTTTVPGQLTATQSCYTSVSASNGLTSHKIEADGAHHYVGGINVCLSSSDQIQGLRVFYRKVDKTASMSAVDGYKEWRDSGATCTWSGKEKCDKGQVAFGYKAYTSDNGKSFAGLALVCGTVVAN